MKKLAMGLCGMLAVLFAGCVPGGPALVLTQAPLINSFDADPLKISTGESAVLSWAVSGATKVSIEPDVGSVALEGKRAVSPASTTTYTLTAVNEVGTVTATVQVVVVAAPAPVPPPSSPPASLPTISFFAANPGSITAGSSSMLSWSVSDATSVAIDGGIGTVGLSGSTAVSPASTTTYTLTATNAAGSVTATTQVIVSAAPGPTVDTTPPSVPSPVSPSSGAILPQKTAPWVFQWSASSDSESGVKLYQLQVYRSGHPPFIDVYTTDTMYTKVAEVAYPYLSNWRWRVRAQNNAGLWSSWSAERNFSVEPRVAYDFIEKAPTAYWWSTPGESLPFPGNTNDARGFACYLTSKKLNDGLTYPRVLETHPKWVDGGYITGKYSAVSIPSGAKLRVKVGFIAGAAAGKVKFRAHKLGATTTWSVVLAYSDGVKEAEVDLSSFAGQTIDFCIGVDAEGSSAQDWAAWVEARIVY